MWNRESTVGAWLTSLSALEACQRVLIRSLSLYWSGVNSESSQGLLCFHLWSGFSWGHQLLAAVLPCTGSSLSAGPLLSQLGERPYWSHVWVTISGCSLPWIPICMYKKLPNGPLQQKRPIQNLIPGFQFVACYLPLFQPRFCTWSASVGLLALFRSNHSKLEFESSLSLNCL